MKKNFTFILLSLLLLVVGGGSAQTTTLVLDKVNSASLSDQVYTDGKVTGATVTFNGTGFNGTYSSGLTGADNSWVADYQKGEVHTFTINLSEGAPAGIHFYVAAEFYGNFNDNNATKYLNETIPEGATSVSYSVSSTTHPDLLSNKDGKGAYKYVWIINQGTSGAKLKISSITRTISTASSVDVPTITPADGTTYDGDLSVTIAKGADNAKVVYSVSGSAAGDVKDAEFTSDKMVLNLTGTGPITVTATGYDSGNNPSSEVTNTYTYVIAAPTITPGTSNYDGELTVTITPGSNNHHAKYTVSGSNEDESNVEITSAKTLNLTGSSTITITATGYNNSDETESSSNTEYNYTYVAPSSGESTVTDNIPHTFNSWDGSNSITLSNSNFSKMELGDYVVFGVAKVEKDGTVLGFRKDWSEPPYVNCTTVSSGNAAKGILNRSDTQWWLKVSNEEVLNAFKNSTVRMQGGMVPKDGGDETSSVDLTSITVYHSKAISETVDNSLTKVNDVIVELTRSFTKDMWNTVCLPFKPTAAQADELFGSGYRIAQFTGVTGTTLEFKTFGIEDFKAGQPYLVKPTENLSNSSPVVLFDVDITAKNGATVTHGDVTHGDYSFTGTFTTKSFAEDDWATTRFVATGNKLNTPNSEKAMKALRCYFTVPAAKSLARGYAIDGFMDDDVPTDISATLNDNVQTTKVIYNLAGQRVANPTKGLYIVNGQKVVVK